MMIVMRRSVQVDHKVRTDLNYPAGFQDVITIPKTDEQFRLLYDTKGRFVLHRITPEESQYKLLRVQKVDSGKKASIGFNPFHSGQARVIPFAVTHDARTIRFIDPIVSTHDVVKFDLRTNKVVGHLKFDVGQLTMITRGANVGRVGTIVNVERHPGSFDIVHLKDRKGNVYATRIGNVFIIGDGTKPWISLPKGKGVKLTVFEERDAALAKKE
jgi:small subunit ribosomal protein S4e